MAEKDKKKTLTISTGFKKKYNFDSSSTDKKKTYSIPQKKNFENNKHFSRNKTNQGQPINNVEKNKKFSRRFVEQQATKAFIKKDDKSATKKVNLN